MVATVAGSGTAVGLRLAAAVAAVFGLPTILESGSILFGTVAAMSLRTGVWAAICWHASRRVAAGHTGAEAP